MWLAEFWGGGTCAPIGELTSIVGFGGAAGASKTCLADIRRSKGRWRERSKKKKRGKEVKLLFTQRAYGRLEQGRNC